MAISGIENINIGLQNEAAGSDSLFIAFNKSQNNFTKLFSCASPTTNFVGGNGIAVESSNSNTYLTITNTGVTSLTAGDGSIVLTQANGNIIITAPGGGGGNGGGVSNINVIGAASGARITSTGGPIISNGIITLDLATSGANAGTYTYPTVTVDQYGRITSIANASSVGTVSSVGVVTTGTGIQISGSPITSAGNISIINTGVTRLNAGTGISLSSSNGNITVSLAGGTAGVSSVGIASNSLVVANTPVTSSGTMSVDLPTNTAIVGNLTVGNNLSVTGNGTITGNLTVTGNIVSSANVIGTLTANNLSVSGASSGNSNVSTVTGNLGLRTLASTYTDNVSAAGTIATAAIHAIGIPTLAASNTVTFTNAASFYIAGGPTAGTNATITTGYALYVNSGNTYFGGANNVIAGNLTVNGNTNYYNVETFVVEDPIITLGGGPNGNALTSNDGKDRGTALQYYTSTPVTAFMGWDNGNSEFSFGSNVSIASEVVTYNSLGNARGLTWLGNINGSTGVFSSSANIPLINSGNSNITLTTNANVSIASNGVANVLVVTSTGANITGTANISGNANAANFGTGTAVITTGNITTINSGLMQNGTANVTIASGGNVSIFANANTTAQLVIANSGINVPGYANVVGLITGGNVSTTGANGTVQANNFTVTGAASGNVNTAAALSNLGFRTVAATYTDTAATGTQANGAIHYIAQPTIGGGTNAKTYTNMSTFYIANAPAATTNATITNSYAMFVGAGNSYFGGLISAAANVTAPIFTSNIAVGTAPFVVTSTTQVANLNVATAGSATNAAAVQTNTSTTNTIYLAGVSSSSNGNSALNIVTGITANFAANSITATTFNGNISNASSVIANAANGTVFSNNYTASGNATGNTNVSTVSGNLGIRALFSTYTDNSAIASATIANAAIHAFAAPNLAAANTAVTFTNAATMYIGGAPVANTNATITNPYSLFVAGGNSYFGGLISASANVTAPIFTSNIATGTAPFTVTSTTRVANLSVAYSNVSDYGVVTAQTTGTYYPVVINAGTSANYALAVGPTGISYNLATNAVTATTFSGNLSGTTATVTGNANIGNINSQSTIGSDFNIRGSTQTTANFGGGPIYIIAGAGNGTGAGGGLNLFAGNAGTTSNAFGGDATFAAGISFGTNLAGANTFIKGGVGTGSGVPGNVAIQVSTALVSGTTTQTLSNIVVVTSTGANITGTANISGNANVNNLGTAQVLASANVTSPQFISNIAVGTAPFVVTSTTQVANLSVATAGTATSATTSGTVTTAAQPNITSVSTSFTGLTFAANGNIAMSGNASQLAGGNLVSANFLVGTGITASGAASGNANIATISGNIGVRALAATYTDTQATVASGNAAIHAIDQPTVGGGTNTKAYTNLSTFYIANAPAVTTNASATNSYAMFVNAGNSYFGGNVRVTAGGITSNNSTAGVGYATGAGSTGTQATSRSTAVAMAAPCVTGSITLFTTTSTANTWNSFAVSNVVCTVSDIVIINFRSGATATSYIPSILSVGANTFTIQIYNQSAIPSDTPIINFAILRAANA